MTVSDAHGGRVVGALVYGCGRPISILALFSDFFPHLHSEKFLIFFGGSGIRVCNAAQLLPRTHMQGGKVTGCIVVVSQKHRHFLRSRHLSDS